MADIPACQVSLSWDGKPPLCGQPAIGIERAMCVHEHFGEAYICATCLAELRRAGADDEWLCNECMDCSEPHDCPKPAVFTELVSTDA